MDTNEMDFLWRLNWWYRPTQLDGLETSVADYYDCFLDWKDLMVINSCPACEADYVAAFVQNLRCDIRARLESKGRSSTRRLTDVFYDAKLEECLISMEEAFKKFQERNLAPRNAPTDKIPIEEVLESSNVSCCDDIIQGNDEVAARVETNVGKTVSPTNDQKVFDVMPNTTSTTLGEELNVDNGLEFQAGASNQDVDNSEAQCLALEALSWLFKEDEKSPPSKLEGAGNAHHLLDEWYSWGPVLGCDVWQPFLTVRSVKADCPLLYKVAERLSVDVRNGSGIHGKLVLPASLPSDPDLKDDAIQASMVVFMFDPGGSSRSCKGRCEVSTPIVTKIHELDFDLCVSKPISFYFWSSNDIGSQLRLLDCDLSNSNHEYLAFGECGNTSGYQNALLQEVAQHVEPLVVGLNCDRLLGSMLSFGPEIVWQHVVVQFWELRAIKGVPIVISIAHFSDKSWVTISSPNVKGSSAVKEIEDCKLSIMYIVLDLLRPGKLVLVFLLSELKHSKLYLSSNGSDGAIAVKFRNLV